MCWQKFFNVLKRYQLRELFFVGGILYKGGIWFEKAANHPAEAEGVHCTAGIHRDAVYALLWHLRHPRGNLSQIWTQRRRHPTMRVIAGTRRSTGVCDCQVYFVFSGMSGFSH